MITYHIAKDGSGNFSSITDALRTLPKEPMEKIRMFIHEGVYKEQLTIQTPQITLIGDSPESTILTFDLYARMHSGDIGRLGTFRSYSCLIDTYSFTAKNLTFENSAGMGPDVGQAPALYVDGDRILFENCRFLGGQDTLFTGPLPPAEKEVNGFIGPKQFAPRVNGRHCYRNCYIEGDVDFIFGSATAYFERCEFFSKNIGRKINGYVTAASTPKGQVYGYVMRHCRFMGNCPPHSVYLGRPWREFAKTVLIDCYMGEHIRPEGWHDWNKPQARNTAFYAEYGSHGPSGDMAHRPAWINRLPKESLSFYDPEKVLGQNEPWYL